MRNISTLFARLLPFLWVGILLVLAFIGIIFFSYVLILGAFVGLVIYGIAYLRSKFFPKKPKTVVEQSTQEQGRTFDYKDFQ